MSAGYLFVPLPERVNRSERPAAVFDRQIPGTFSGSVDVRFISEQPIHVGSGFKVLQNGKAVRSAVRIRGGPGLPGSSVKGMIRSRYEAMTYSCVAKPKGYEKEKLAVKSSTGITHAKLKPGLLEHLVFEQCEAGGSHRCPACALFGCMSHRSHVSVFDFSADEEVPFATLRMPEQFSPNLHHIGQCRPIPENSFKLGATEIFEVTSLFGRKFALGQGPLADNPVYQPVEAIPQGTVLRGQIRFINILAAELGGLLTALGKEPPSKLKIGGGKAHGFGRLRLLTAGFYLHGRPEPVEAARVGQWREAFVNDLENRFVLGEQELIRIHQENC